MLVPSPASRTKNLLFLGVLVLTSITAIGGSTICDVLLSRHPIFWIQDAGPIYTIRAATASTLLWVHFLRVPIDSLLFADAMGLAVFALSGAQVTEKAGCKPLVIILMGHADRLGRQLCCRCLRRRLVHCSSRGYCLMQQHSRRINIQHRLVYQVLEDEQVVKVLRFWSRYE